MKRAVMVMAAVLAAAGAARAQGLPATVPAALLADLARAPDRVEAAAARIVHGYGNGGRMTAADVDRAIAVERAAARGREVGRLLSADLDADGTVTLAEAAAAGAALSAGGRSRLMRMLAVADANRDDRIDPAEVAAAAGAAALRAVTDAEAARDRALMALDLDADGSVTLAEVRQAALLAAAAAPPPADDA